MTLAIPGPIGQGMRWILALTLALPAENLITLTGGWQASVWSSCNKSSAADAARGALMPAGCAAGSQTREVSCGLANSLPCIGAQPEGSRTCGHGDLCGYSISAWAPCDAPCGGKGKQTRQAYCLEPTLPGACKKPVPIALEQQCNGETQGCDWYRGTWGDCSTRCGKGVQRRHVACLKVEGCRDEEPPTKRDCEEFSCTWSLSAWSDCSKGCGQYGSQERTRTCPYAGTCSGLPKVSQSCQGDPCPTTPIPVTNSPPPDRLMSEDATPAPTPAPTSAPVPAKDIPKYSWLLSSWDECKGNCGSWKYRERTVACIETCSVPLACPKASLFNCEALHATPALLEDCGIMEKCTTTTTLRLTSGPPESATTTVTTVAAPVTTVASGSSGGGISNDGNSNNGGSVVIGNPDDWECKVVLGQKATDGSCVTGAKADSLCGVGCPCCQRKSLSQIQDDGSVTRAVSPPASDSTSTVIMAVGGAAAAGFVLALGYLLCKFRKNMQRVKMKDSSSMVQQNPTVKRQSSQDVDPTYSETSDGRSRKGAWNEPPEIDTDLPRTKSSSSSQRRATFTEDVDDASTSDSEHDGADRSSRRSADRAPREADASRNGDRSKVKRSQTQGTTAPDRERRHSGHGGESPPRRSKSSPASDREEKPKSASQMRAEAAFDEGLGAGKVREPKPDKKKRRSSSGSSSGHPKGTAVPPRKSDTPAEHPPSSSSSGGGASAERPASSSAGGKSSSKSSSEPPPASESATGGATPTANSNQEAKADVGVATNINEHVLKLDSDLDASRTEDAEWRRKNFKTLLLKWHPDKNKSGMGEAESEAQANEVFKHLLARRDRYLAGE